MTVIYLTPRCRRPPDGVVRLDGLWLHTEQANYRVPVSNIRLAPATTPHVLEAVSVLPSATRTALRLKLRDWPQTLLTTARWQVTLPHAAPVIVTHVIHWLLPATPAPVLTDDTWLWHLSPDAGRPPHQSGGLAAHGRPRDHAVPPATLQPVRYRYP